MDLKVPDAQLVCREPCFHSPTHCPASGRLQTPDTMGMLFMIPMFRSDSGHDGTD